MGEQAEWGARRARGKRAQPARLAFDAPIASPTEARKALVALVKKARAALET